MGDILLPASWFGLAAGLLELGAVLIQDAIDPKVTVDAIRTNRHYPWMIPLSDLTLLLVPGLMLALLARRGVKPFGPRASRIFVALSALAPLLVIRGLHPAACVLLAGGLATSIGPFLMRRASGCSRMVRITLPILAAIVTTLALVRGSAVIKAESRALAALPPARPGSPNVLLIVMDNVRADHLSLHGYHRDTSPNLTQLAQRGIRYNHARATAPWTLPSHAGMLTGRWPHELSCNVDHPMDDTYPTLAEYLARHGYATAGFVGNTYYCNAWYGIDRGFARYEDFPQNTAINAREILRASALGGRLVSAAGFAVETPGARRSRKTAAMINRDALGWIDAHRDRPFFVFLNYYDAHEPFNPPDGYRRRYGLSALDARQRASIHKRLRNLEKSGGADAHQAAEVIRQASELLRDSFDDCIAYLDGQLGELFDQLRRRGILENTLVIVTSDHGEHFGERGLFAHGNSLYRPLLDVPLVIVPPGGTTSKSQAVVDAPVSLRRLPATVARWIDPAGRSPFPGRPLTGLVAYEAGARQPAEEWPFSEVEHQRKFPPSPHIPASLGPLWAITGGGRTYIRSADGREELYDFDNDPAETNNLAGTPQAAADLARHRDELERRLRSGSPAREN
jgi:arylsulfatase A-like enzyme